MGQLIAGLKPFEEQMEDLVRESEATNEVLVGRAVEAIST